jgi:hypothetical protein
MMILAQFDDDVVQPRNGLRHEQVRGRVEHVTFAIWGLSRSRLAVLGYGVDRSC